MTCTQIQHWLNELADRREPGAESPAVAEHLAVCGECRELSDGFRLLEQGFLVTPPPRPSPLLADRIVNAVRRERTHERRRSFELFRYVVAAVILIAALAAAAIGVRSRQSVDRPAEFARIAQPVGVRAADSPRITPGSVSSPSEPIFPELATPGTEDPRRELVLAEAVGTFSNIIVALGQDMVEPVQPITRATTGAFQSFIKDVSMPSMPNMSLPGMPQMPMRRMGGMQSS